MCTVTYHTNSCTWWNSIYVCVCLLLLVKVWHVGAYYNKLALSNSKDGLLFEMENFSLVCTIAFHECMFASHTENWYLNCSASLFMLTLTSQPACRLILYYSCLFVRVKIFSRGNIDAFSHILKRCFLWAGIPRSWWRTSTSWTAQGKWRRCDFKTSWCSWGSAQITHTSLTERNQVMSDDKRCQWDRTADG